MRTLIITPLFFGGGSGASVYYNILAKCLAQRHYLISVISDREVGAFPGEYYALFPKRCGRERKRIRDLLLYALQNLTYMVIPFVVLREKPDTIIVHSSFYNHLGVFPFIMMLIRKLFPEVQLVLDVRDRLLPDCRMKYLNSYRHIVACSENTLAHLLSGAVNRKRVSLIPVIQEKLSVDGKKKPKTLARFNLSGKKYLLYVGLVKESKGVDLLLEAFQYIRKDMPELALVLCGLMKTTSASTKQLLGQEGVVYLGNQSREDILILMQCAEVCINLSPNEGMPRSSLEALAIGRPVLLPRNIPEFVKHCPEFVIESRDPRVVAEKTIWIQKEGAVPLYPIERHFPENVIPEYISIFNAKREGVGEGGGKGAS